METHYNKGYVKSVSLNVFLVNDMYSRNLISTLNEDLLYYINYLSFVKYFMMNRTMILFKHLNKKQWNQTDKLYILFTKLYTTRKIFSNYKLYS